MQSTQTLILSEPIWWRLESGAIVNLRGLRMIEPDDSFFIIPEQEQTELVQFGQIHVVEISNDGELEVAKYNISYNDYIAISKKLSADFNSTENYICSGKI